MLTDQQQTQFAEQGYLALPDFLPPSLLERLQRLFDELLVPGAAPSQVVHQHKGQRYVTNLDGLCAAGDLTCLELLGFPPLLEIARTICGDDFFLIQEFAVIKHRGDDMPVLWHQDMVHRRSAPCFTMGIYLDPANSGDGALRVVPGSHLSGKEICALAEEPFVEMPMEAGGVLIHDMMLAHASEPLQQGALRRVVYFEFLSARHVSAEAIYSDALVARRARLLFAASRLFEARNPGAERFVHSWPNPLPGDAELEVPEIVAEIYSQPINARPSSYCVNGQSIFSAEFR